VRTRVNQQFFRATVLAAYRHRCCITGLTIPDLLNASHIVPWSVDTKNRVNPRNGLCLNAIHDRAFDRGLLTITPDYKVKLSSVLLSSVRDPAVKELFLPYDNKSIELPDHFIPETSMLQYHNEMLFKK
jgi:putative restriction endonuclease